MAFSFYKADSKPRNKAVYKTFGRHRGELCGYGHTAQKIGHKGSKAAAYRPVVPAAGKPAKEYGYMYRGKNTADTSGDKMEKAGKYCSKSKT